MNEAARAAATVTVLVALFEAEPEVAVNETEYVPALAKTWLGFLTVLVPASPKVQAHDVGLPVDVSVNWTAWPATGDAGLNVNEAAMAEVTVTVRVV